VLESHDRRKYHRIPTDQVISFAEVDHSVPDHVIPDLRTAVEKAGCNATIEIYPGTQHGFQFSERMVYAPEASEQAWDKIFKLWERNLK